MALPPPKPVNLSAVTKAIVTAGNETLKVIKSDFGLTTRTWNTKVIFNTVPMRPSGQNLEGAVGTTSKIYMYVTRGTKAHLIRAKRGKSLSFQGGYRAKTSRRRLGSSSGGSFGKRVFAQVVKHPGTQAREFEEAIADNRSNLLQANVNQAIIKALQ